MVDRGKGLGGLRREGRSREERVGLLRRSLMGEDRGDERRSRSRGFEERLGS